jgi:hypothetical protein
VFLIVLCRQPKEPVYVLAGDWEFAMCTAPNDMIGTPEVTQQNSKSICFVLKKPITTTGWSITDEFVGWKG